MKYLFFYIVIVNFITFLMFAIDKKKAIKNEWRIPEAWLLFFSFIGGSLGGVLAMKIMKHKTKKPKFTIIMPVLLLINILTVYYIISYLTNLL